MKGIDTKIDNLGRILIPIKYRKALKLKADSRINISIINDSILITPSEVKCLICGNQNDIDTKFNLCFSCIDKIKSDI